MKRVGKVLSEKSLKAISDNIFNKYNISVSVEVDVWTHSHTSKTLTYRIYIALPNNNGYFLPKADSWNDLLKQYDQIMKEGLPNA